MVDAHPMNCWECKKCGREPGGVNAEQFGICPAATETKFNGCNSGINAGRACWVVAGTFCKIKARGMYAQEIETCLNCEFFIKVKIEENLAYLKPTELTKLSEKI